MNTQAAANSETVACPYCKEAILPGAIKCKHCGSAVAAAKPSHQGVCPYCKEAINAEATKCKHCRSIVGGGEGGCGCSGDPDVPTTMGARVGQGGGGAGSPGRVGRPPLECFVQAVLMYFECMRSGEMKNEGKAKACYDQAVAWFDLCRTGPTPY